MTSKKFEILERLWHDRKSFDRTTEWIKLPMNYALSSVHKRLKSKGRTGKISFPGFENSFFFRYGTTDLLTFMEVIVEQEYDFLFEQGLENVSTIVDLGANVGYSLRLWLKFYPTAKIYALEPDDANIGLCRKNIQLEPNVKNVSLAKGLVGARDGMRQLDRSGGEWAYRIAEGNSADSEFIPCRTVDSQLNEFDLNDRPIDLIKFDIEGAEREIFGSLGEWIYRTKNLVVETHFPFSVDSLIQELNSIDIKWNLYKKNHNLILLSRTT